MYFHQDDEKTFIGKYVIKPCGDGVMRFDNYDSAFISISNINVRVTVYPRERCSITVSLKMTKGNGILSSAWKWLYRVCLQIAPF